MSSKLVAIGSSCFAGALAWLCATSYAGNITTSGVICRAYNVEQALEIRHLGNGVWNLEHTAREVVCPVPRAPSAGTFRIDGYNTAGTCTSCTVAMYHADGVMVASRAVMGCAGTISQDWTRTVSFSVTATDDYARVLCTIPGDGAGILYGITAVQQ